MMPAFEIGGGALLVLARALFVAMLLASFGTLLFLVLVGPRALARADPRVRAGLERRLLGLVRVELAAALLSLPVWLAVQAADMAGAGSLREVASATGPVLAATAFGHLVLMQEGVLLLAALALGPPAGAPATRLRLAVALLTVALLLQAGHGHGWAMSGGPSLLLVASMLHLLAAGGWLGGLPPLLLLALAAPPRLGAAAARWFSPLGKLCVAGMVVSSIVQFWQLIGGLPGLLGTAYGWVAGAKILLLGVLLGFALLNRHRLAPALLGSLPEQARRRLAGSLALQTLVGLATVLAAGVLGSLPPSIHVQPVWPFAWRVSLEAVRGDGGIRNEVAGAVLALVGALLAALVVLLQRRRLRWATWPALGLAALVVWRAAPHLDLLFVAAHPVSFYRSPTGFRAASIARGAAMFPHACASITGLSPSGFREGFRGAQLLIGGDGWLRDIEPEPLPSRPVAATDMDPGRMRM